MIVGWQLAARMRTDLVLDALTMALGRREPGADVELVHHSDRGSQYTSIDYTQTLTDHKVLASVGSVGDAYDNALAETLWVPRTPFGFRPSSIPALLGYPVHPASQSCQRLPSLFHARARGYQTASSLARWMGSPPRRVSVGFEERPATQRFCTRAASRRAGRDGGGDRAAATQHVAPAH